MITQARGQLLSTDVARVPPACRCLSACLSPCRDKKMTITPLNYGR
uniref:Uncharacterized protein n=1 Tax=Anguilla anguilla TaxID=7936 RepID=A0A0E9RUX9_ANGAN